MPVASTAPESPAARAKGTVKPSDMPITMSRTIALPVKCLWGWGAWDMALRTSGRLWRWIGFLGFLAMIMHVRLLTMQDSVRYANGIKLLNPPFGRSNRADFRFPEIPFSGRS